jgi:hypothetical protein
VCANQTGFEKGIPQLFMRCMAGYSFCIIQLFDWIRVAMSMQGSKSMS